MTPQEKVFIDRAMAIELPANKEVELIIRGVHEGWSDSRLKLERYRAKFALFLEQLLDTVEEVKTLVEGSDEEC